MRLVLRILTSTPGDHRTHLVDLSIDRFERVSEPHFEALYLRSAFSLDPTRTTNTLLSKLDHITPSHRGALATQILPLLFGKAFIPKDEESPALPFACLETLVVAAFDIIRVEEDNTFNPGQVRTADDRDGAERARDAAFNKLASQKGRMSFDALMRLSDKTNFPISPERLKSLARDRAEQDSENDPWWPEDVVSFEKTSDALPRTACDLQRLMQP
jgi:hypothetical protein